MTAVTNVNPPNLPTVAPSSSSPGRAKSAGSERASVGGGDIQAGTLKSAIPLSEAWAPQFMVKGDLNGDAQLSQDEFTDLLGKAAIEKDRALALFEEFGGSGDQGITLDQLLEGIKASNARGDGVFAQLTSAVTYTQQGTLDASVLKEFLQAGAALAEQFWGGRA